jgi:hypothetical protein
MTLAKANPYGRLDVLAYRLSERLCTELEQYYGVTGIWAAIEEYIEDGIEDIKLKKIPQPLLEAITRVIEMRKNDTVKR